MEKFLALPEPKRKAVIDAALLLFGKVGYKKASAKDIATKAGISKSMLFHYFGSKKSLYLYLVTYAGDIIMEALAELKMTFSNDFFDRVLRGMEAKLAMMQEHPALGEFLTAAYFEDDPEVVVEVRAYWKRAEGFRNQFTLEDLDTGKFKDSVKPELVLDILVKYSEGFIRSAAAWRGADLERMVAQFTECLLMMKHNFYKTEYLEGGIPE